MLNPWLFLKRIRHCAGFGVQSPSDYAFVREVIYERSPYYAYGELDREYKECSGRERWIGRLLLRVSNHVQAERVHYLGEFNALHHDAIRKGCRKSEIVDDEKFGDKDLIVVPNLNTVGKEVWARVVGSPHVVAFDLYYIGIAFCRHNRYPETHVINPY